MFVVTDDHSANVKIFLLLVLHFSLSILSVGILIKSALEISSASDTFKFKFLTLTIKF